MKWQSAGLDTGSAQCYPGTRSARLPRVADFRPLWISLIQSIEPCGRPSWKHSSDSEIASALRPMDHVRAFMISRAINDVFKKVVTGTSVEVVPTAKRTTVYVLSHCVTFHAATAKRILA